MTQLSQSEITIKCFYHGESVGAQGVKSTSCLPQSTRIYRRNWATLRRILWTELTIDQESE